MYALPVRHSGHCPMQKLKICLRVPFIRVFALRADCLLLRARVYWKRFSTRFRKDCSPRCGLLRLVLLLPRFSLASPHSQFIFCVASASHWRFETPKRWPSCRTSRAVILLSRSSAILASNFLACGINTFQTNNLGFVLEREVSRRARTQKVRGA